ncbi:uncharacterized protein LOC144990345 isoform X1 [Oryzias latipes]
MPLLHFKNGGNRQQLEAFLSLFWCGCAPFATLIEKARVRMEETLQQERQELEDTIQNEEEGGIRRRLRDRDLLRKRKAEAEEKETYQWVFGVESQRKRSRTQNGTKRRGRPRKIDSGPHMSVVQEEAPDTQFPPTAAVAPAAAAADISEQISGFLPPCVVKESTSAPALASPGLDFVQSSVFDSTLPSSAPLNPVLVTFSPAPLQDSASLPALTPDGAPPLSLTTGLAPAFAPSPAPLFGPSPAPAPPAPVLGPTPAPAPALFQDGVPAPALVPPSAPSQLENLYVEPGQEENLEKVQIEDLGPDEEEDVSAYPGKGTDADLKETMLINAPEQNKIFSVQTLPSTPQYLPGN